MNCVFYLFGNTLYTYLVLIILLQGCTMNVKEEKTLPPNGFSLEEKSLIELNNPAIFMGSTFGEFFQILHRTGKYDEMLVYTSKQTKEKYKKKDLISFYQNMNFSYPLKLKAYKDYTLYYQTNTDATARTIQMLVSIENDTCKMIFNYLKNEKPFTGL